jgi:hypothetical protein
MSNTRCEQDLVGFNPQNSAQVLTIGVPTIVNDALVIDTRAITPYSGSVQLSISNELGMTATFVESGTTTLTKTVVAGQLLYIPLRVTATDCGYDRCGSWQFTVYYFSDPVYGDNTGGGEPTPCDKPNRQVKICRFDAKIQNKCLADFKEKLIEVNSDSTGIIATEFKLGYSPQCTGPIEVIFASDCEDGITFSDLSDTNISYTLSNNDRILLVRAEYGYELDTFPLEINYDSISGINCFCNIRANITFDSCDNPNLINLYNNGTLSGYPTQAFFNAAGISARSSTIFTTTVNPVAGTALRVQIANPVDDTNRPQPTIPVNTSITTGSIIWQGDTTQAFPITSGERYWLKCKGRVQSSLHLIKANEEVHLDRYFVTGGGTFNPAIPYFTQYTPGGQWHDIGIRWQATGVNPKVTPFVRYINTFASFSNTLLIGDLLLNGESFSDWANIELTKYYPSDCIECPQRTMTISRKGCDYETILDLSFGEGQECVTIELNDESLFGYTPGHAQANFDLYRKVLVTLPDGSQQILSSVVPYNILIDPASINPLQPFTTYPVSQGGFYDFTLINVPTFNPIVTYNGTTDCVCLLDSGGNIRFFQSTASAPGYTPLVTAGWQNYWIEISEGNLDEKYSDTQTYSNFCFLDACIDEYRNRLYCSVKDFCNVNICDNECIQNYLYLLSVKKFLDNGGVFVNQRDVLNYLKKLCSTCNCQ